MKKFFKSNTFLSVFMLGIVISFFLGLVMLWFRSYAYAQGEAVLSNPSAIPVNFMYPWIISGSIASVFLGFARSRYLLFKRFFDLFVSVLSLIILSPLFLIIYIIVRVDSEGPAFFKQKRLGRNGMTFEILKFRTMRNNAELQTGPVWAQDNDPRITKVGHFLRKSHLDEIPQFINVIFGHMSLIGPRPERPELTTGISESVPGFLNRLEVKPGITGLAQTRYRYGASIKDAARKLKYDCLYLKKMCWLLDFQIILWTMQRMLTGEGSR
ncbi:MAG: sugar transferase [Candidatus Omnitrophota bacterium]